jgi:tetratricopeptide (TPR) repeat protein
MKKGTRKVGHITDRETVLNTADVTSLLENSERLGHEGVVSELLEAIRRSGISTSEAIQRIDLALSTFREFWVASGGLDLAILTNLGESYERLGGLRQAEALYREVIDGTEGSDLATLRANNYRKLGRLKRRQGQWQEALEAVQAAREIFEPLGDEVGSARCRQVEGAIQWSRGDGAAARASFEYALEIAERRDVASLTLASCMSLGLVDLLSGDYDQGAI